MLDFNQSLGKGEGPNNQNRRIWDRGPPHPVFVDEKEPAKPAADLTGSESAIAQAEYEVDMAAWHQRRADYAAAYRTYREWHEANRAPLLHTVPYVDSKEWLARDPDRYCLYWPDQDPPASNGPAAASAAA